MITCIVAEWFTCETILLYTDKTEKKNGILKTMLGYKVGMHVVSKWVSKEVSK